MRNTQAQSILLNTQPDAQSVYENRNLEQDLGKYEKKSQYNNMSNEAVDAKMRLLEGENQELRNQLNERLGSVRSENNLMVMKRSEIIASPSQNGKNYDRMACNLLVNKMKDA